MGGNLLRCASGIEGYDNLCQGGFVNNSINLVLGNAGSGKTTFLFQFLHNGFIQHKEKGLFVSFEQEITDLYRTAKKQNMDFEKLEKQQGCFITKFEPDIPIRDMQRELIKIITKHDIKRICFDSINVLSMELPKEVNIRRQIYNFFSLLKKIDACVLVSGESDYETEGINQFQDCILFAKYLSDSVTELFSSGISGTGDRAIRILKMRMTNHLRGPIGMQISDVGISVLKK